MGKGVAVVLNANKNSIIKEYLAGASTCALGRAYGCSNAAIFLFLRANGVEIRQTKKITPEVLLTIERMSRAGKSGYAIQQELGLSNGTVDRALAKLKLNRPENRKQRKDPLVAHKNDIILRYLNGDGTYLIGQAYGCQDSSIVRSLQRWGIELRPLRQYKLNERFFEIIDTEAKAYFLGVMVTDGSVDKKGLVRLTMTDLDVIEKFKLATASENEIKVKAAKLEGHKDQYLLEWGSIKMVNDLTKLGCCPAKTFVTRFPEDGEIPQDLMQHYILGLQDGDGGISVKHHHTRKSAAYWHLCGNHLLIHGVTKFLKDKLDITCNTKQCVQAHKNIWRCRVAIREELKRLLLWLYQDASIYMARKYEKYWELRRAWNF